MEKTRLREIEQETERLKLIDNQITNKLGIDAGYLNRSAFEEELRKLDLKGISHSIKTTADLDEAPGAYKDINVVMEEQKDLVKILVRLEPLGVIKG